MAGAPSADDLVLLASELATNVVVHAQTPFTVRVLPSDGTVRLEVSDGSSILPAVQDLATFKFGLRIVESMSDRWGIESDESGKTVWVERA